MENILGKELEAEYLSEVKKTAFSHNYEGKKCSMQAKTDDEVYTALIVKKIKGK